MPRQRRLQRRIGARTDDDAVAALRIHVDAGSAGRRLHDHVAQVDAVGRAQDPRQLRAQVVESTQHGEQFVGGLIGSGWHGLVKRHRASRRKQARI